MYELWFLNYYSTKISDRCFYTVLYMLTLGGVRTGLEGNTKRVLLSEEGHRSGIVEQ